MLVSSIGRSITPTDKMLDEVGSELVKNAGYWQPIFFKLAAIKDEEIGFQWQAQKDYEYLVSLHPEEIVEEANCCLGFNAVCN